MALVVATGTDLGRRRQQNEDCFGTWTPADPVERGRRGTLLVVADGMGGAAAGEVASRIAVETVLECYRASTLTAPHEALRAALEEANRRVHHEGMLHEECRGMGTTCTAAVVRGRQVAIAHVGDSRAYLVHGPALRALTRDHTLVAQLTAEGRLTLEEARTDARRNVVTRCIGVGDQVQVDAEDWGAMLEPGDALLLCTDGLHGVVEDVELAHAIAAASPDEACRGLVALANERGGPDNITLIVARTTAEAEPAPRVAAPPAPRVTPLPAPPREWPVAPPARGAVVPPPASPWSPTLILALAGLGVLFVLIVLAALRLAR